MPAALLPIVSQVLGRQWVKAGSSYLTANAVEVVVTGRIRAALEKRRRRRDGALEEEPSESDRIVELDRSVVVAQRADPTPIG